MAALFTCVHHNLQLIKGSAFVHDIGAETVHKVVLHNRKARGEQHKTY